MKPILKNELSILIPTYNYPCRKLVECLAEQTSIIQSENNSFKFEIIVAEDGSTDYLDENRCIDKIKNCKHIVRSENTGRACIRNFLAQQTSYNWLLFIDSDMVVYDKEFILNYISNNSETVVDGGVKIMGDYDSLKNNLRFIYEKSSEKEHTYNKRKKNPFAHFHTANFIIKRDIMLAHPFDERFRKYGYEDVLLGKYLKSSGIPIEHIDNPLSFEVFETNKEFIGKTEEGLRTLYDFRQELDGYSNILNAKRKTDRLHISGAIRLFHKLFGKAIRKNLIGNKPDIRLFNIYKLGFYLLSYP